MYGLCGNVTIKRVVKVSKFLYKKRPRIVAMLSIGEPKETIEKINRCLSQGAEGFCLLYQSCPLEFKTKDNLKKIMDVARKKPVYFANYIRDNSQSELSDDILAQQLLEAIDMGAQLIDVRTDMFCRSTDEVTCDSSAVEQQKSLISEIHNRGAEVIMSTHIFEYRSPQNVLEIAKLQQERGVDIAKVVTTVDSKKELDDAFKTLFLLKENLNIPFLFLTNGSFHRYHRIVGPLLGSCIYLCVEKSVVGATQPTIDEAKMIIEKVAMIKENKND